VRFRWLRVVVLAAVILQPVVARADGFDVVWFFTRVPEWDLHPIRGVLALAALMAANYLLNLLVIGLPAMKLGTPRARVGRDLIGFTLLGQVADRLGAILGGMSLYFLAPKSESEVGLVILAALVASFLLSGLFIGLLARHYLTRRWKLTGRAVPWIVTAAALLTNPAWAMATAYLYDQ